MGVVSIPETHYRNPDTLMDRLHNGFAARGKVTVIKANGFDALCPCHGDTTPSLHVAKGDTTIVMKCRACEAGAEQVLAAVGFADDDGQTMTVASLFYESKRKATPSSKPKAVALEARVQEQRPKADVVPINKGKAQAPPTKFGSSVSKVDHERLLAAPDVMARLDVERGIDADTVKDVGLGLSHDGRIVLPTYNREGEGSPRLWRWPDERTDELRKMDGKSVSSPDLSPRPESPTLAEGQAVYLVEGELDALVGFSNGLATIGCPGTNMWKPTDAERFVKFSQVTILADADKAGRDWATKVEGDLRAAGVRVIVRDFGEGVPKGYDLTDYALQCRADGVLLGAAIEQLPIFVAGSQSSDLFGEVPPAEVATIGGQLWYRGSVHVLFGLGGAGKTYLFLTSARDEIRNGGRVLFVDYETGVRTIRRRLQALGFTQDELGSFIHLDVKSGKAKPLNGDEAMTRAWLDVFRPTLIGIDSWSSVHGAIGLESVKEEQAVEQALSQLFRPLTRTDAAVVILDHVPKGETAARGYPFGSQRKRTGSDVTYEAKSGNKGRTNIKCYKDAVGDLPNDGETIAEYTYGNGIAGIVMANLEAIKENKSTKDNWRPTGYMERVSKLVEDAGAAGVTATQITDGIAGKSAHLRTARDCLVSEGYVANATTDSSGEKFTAARFVSVKPYREADDDAAA